MLSVRAAGPTIHHEALDWATRAAANGGVISTTTIRAVSEFCRAVDLAGIRDRFLRLNLFAGGNLSGALVPLYRSTSFGGTVIGNTTDTNVNFVSGDYAETGASGGLKGNGTNKYLDTGLLTSSITDRQSVHLSASATSMEQSSGANRVIIGAFNGSNSLLHQLYALHSTFGRIAQFGVNSSSAPTISSPAAEELHFIGVRSSITSASIYRAGTLAASNATTATSQSGSLSYFVFASNVSGGAQSFTSSRARMYSIGNALTSSQAAAFSAAVIAFNSVLGR